MPFLPLMVWPAGDGMLVCKGWLLGLMISAAVPHSRTSRTTLLGCYEWSSGAQSAFLIADCTVTATGESCSNKSEHSQVLAEWAAFTDLANPAHVLLLPIKLFLRYIDVPSLRYHCFCTVTTPYSGHMCRRINHNGPCVGYDLLHVASATIMLAVAQTLPLALRRTVLRSSPVLTLQHSCAGLQGPTHSGARSSRLRFRAGTSW